MAVHRPDRCCPTYVSYFAAKTSAVDWGLHIRKLGHDFLTQSHFQPPYANARRCWANSKAKASDKRNVRYGVICRMAGFFFKALTTAIRLLSLI